MVFLNGHTQIFETVLSTPELSRSEARRAVASLALSGAPDGQTAYFAIPGSTSEGWDQIVRLIAPLRSYIVEGEDSYLRPQLILSEYQPVMDVQGDCAEDVRPLSEANLQRRALEREYFESRRGA